MPQHRVQDGGVTGAELGIVRVVAAATIVPHRHAGAMGRQRTAQGQLRLGIEIDFGRHHRSKNPIAVTADFVGIDNLRIEMPQGKERLNSHHSLPSVIGDSPSAGAQRKFAVVPT